MDIKINIADKSGKTVKKELKEDQASSLYNKKIGDKFHGELIDMPGYEFEVAGGSDYCGFPMRKDVSGTMRKAILTTTGLGNKYVRKGMRLRRVKIRREERIIYFFNLQYFSLKAFSSPYFKKSF